MKLLTLTSLSIGSTFILSSSAMAQSVYSADWTTLSGSEGSYTLNMTHESGAVINSITSYSLTIKNDNGRDYYDAGSGFGGTTGPNADLASETNTFSVSAALFSGVATIQSSDIEKFVNFTDIKGIVLNPTGTATSTFPSPTLGESDSTSMSWSSRNFGFDTERTNPDAGGNIWDEYNYTLSQTWNPSKVPEPSSVALLGLGSLGLLLRRKR